MTEVKFSPRDSREHRLRRVVVFAAAMGLLTLGLGSAISHAAEAGYVIAAAPAASDFAIANGSRTFKKPRGVREWIYTMARGPSLFDRIALHRMTRGARPPAHPHLVMLYLPGTNMNGEVAVDDPRYSMPLFMAGQGVDVWTIDYRTHFIAPGTPATDLAELKQWTSDLFEADIEAAARFVMAATGRKKIYLAGFSRGASFAYLFAARNPQAVQGLVIFDGWIPAGRSVVAPPPPRAADDVGGAHLTYDKRQALMEAVIANPDGPAPIAKYKTARENLEAVVYGAGGAFGGHGGLANPGGGYSDAIVLARMLAAYDRYWPAIQDYENPFTAADRARLAASKIPVIAFSSTNIGAQWPLRVAHSAAATGSADVTVKTLSGWGHLDVICGTQAEVKVFRPALIFLRQRPK